MPREMLYSNEMATIAKRHFSENPSWQEKSVIIDVSGIPIEVVYYYNSERNAVVIPSPLAVKKMIGSDFFEPDFTEVVYHIEKDLNSKNFSISGSLIGKGAAECHYVAFHQDRQGKIALFDSKFSDPERFLSASDKPSLWEKLIGYLQAPFRFIAFSLGFGQITEAKFLDQNIKVHRLGTQPALDGVSCGYHSIGAVLAMSDEISHNSNSSLAKIEQVVKQNKQLDGKAEAYFLASDQPITEFPAISSALSTMPRAGEAADSSPEPELSTELLSPIPLATAKEEPLDASRGSLDNAERSP